MGANTDEEGTTDELDFCVNFKSSAHLDDAVHVWNEAVNADLQKHDQSPAHVLPHFAVLVASQRKQTLVSKKRKGEKMEKSNEA